MQLLGKAKDACLRKKPGDFSDRKPCGAVRFNHVDTALLQEANDWVEKEWQEGPRSAWHLNCLVYSVAMAVRGKTTNESQPCNQGRKSDNQKGSKRQEGVLGVFGHLQKMPVSERNLEISLIENPVGQCGSTMLIRHCFRRPMIGWRKSGRKALGRPGT